MIVPLPTTVGAVQSKYNMLLAAPAPLGALVVIFMPLTCDGTPHHAAYTIEAFGKLEKVEPEVPVHTPVPVTGITR